MALRSAFWRAVGRAAGAQAVDRSHSCTSYVSFSRPVLLSSLASAPSSSVALEDVHYDEACISLTCPSISDTEPEPSDSGRQSVVRFSLVDARDPPELSQWLQSCRGHSILHHGDHGRRLLDSGTKFLSFASMLGGSLAASVIRNRAQEGCNWGSQVRRISSFGWNSSPRKTERYSGRSADRNLSPHLANRQAIFDENFKCLPVVKVKKPHAEYKQGIVDNSTKNMPLVPKKWKRALPSKEVLDAVMYLRRAKSNRDAVREVVRKRISRMLKLEMMLVLSELQRLDECFLAHQAQMMARSIQRDQLSLQPKDRNKCGFDKAASCLLDKVFNAVRNEPWYKPNLYLYQTMVQTFGRSKQIKDVLRMYEELEAEGLRSDESIKRELLRAYVISDMMSEAINVYKKIQKSGPLDRAARSILFHGLNEEQKLELAVYEKTQGYDWS